MDNDDLRCVYRLREQLQGELPRNSAITHNFTNAWLPLPNFPNAQIVGHGIRLEIKIPNEKKLIVCYPATAYLSKERIHCAALRQAQAFYKTRQQKAAEAKNKQLAKLRQPVKPLAETPPITTTTAKKDEEYTKTDAQMDAELGAILSANSDEAKK